MPVGFIPLPTLDGSVPVARSGGLVSTRVNSA